MINEIVDNFHDLLAIANRGLAKVFNDPWPPVSPNISNKNRAAHFTPRTSGRSPSHTAADSPSPRTRRTETVTRTKVTTRKSVASSTTHRAIVATPRKPAVISRPKEHFTSSPAIIKSNATRRPSSITRHNSITSIPRPKAPPIPRIIAQDINIDVDRCDVLVIAIVEMEICKEIFAGWSAQLDLAEPRKKDHLEQTIVTEVQKLNDHSNEALNSSHSLLHSYRVLTHITEKRLGTLALSRSGGKLYISSDYEKIASTIALHSASLISQVKQIQERLRNLVSDIEKTKEQARRRALRRRIWSWLVKTFRAISFLISAGGAIFALFHPLGLLDTAAITVASMLSGAVAKLCENTQKKYDETTFDEILVFMRDHVPESTKAAEIALTNFQACHRILQVELDVRRGRRIDWMSPQEAKRAHSAWHSVNKKLEAMPTAVSTPFA